MTEDYKDSLFGYITGNVPYEPVSDNSIQLEDTQLVDLVEGENRQTGVLKYLLKDTNGNENGLVLYVYNIEDQETGHNRSYWEMKTISGDYIKTFTEFTSGAELPWIADILVEDDGTLFIATYPGTTSFPHRIMILNNICNKISGEYVVKIRKSYDIDDYTGESALYVDKIYKSLTEAKYILVGHENVSGGNSKKFEILECTINVGAENEYNFIDNLSSIGGSPWVYDTYIKWNVDGEYKLKILVATQETPQNYINELIKDYTSTTLEHNFDSPCNNTNNTRFLYSEYEQLVLGVYYDSTSRNLFYSVIYILGQNATITQEYELIETYSSGTSVNLNDFSHFNIKNDILYLPLIKNDGKVYMYAYKARYYEDQSYETYNVSDKMIYDSIDPSKLTKGLCEIIVNKVYELFNLYTFVDILDGGTQHSNAHLLNQYVLPSSPYKISANQYYPNLSILRDNDKILFARTLYNLIRQQNTITSTVNVPNLMLNDNQITKEQLLAKEYNMIDEDNETIEKNIYEDLLINFNDTITVVNNNTDNNVVNTEASVDIVKDLISRELNKMMLKYRIVYQDNTSEVIELPTPTIEDRVATYNLVVGSNKAINRIEFISWDETTTYVIITLNVEANKVYIINQKVRVR